MNITQLLEEERKIWGDKPQTLEHIVIAMGKVYGDICKQARSQIENGTFNETELKKEFGNMVASTIRWMDDLGFGSNECIELALKSQQIYRESN